MRSTFECLALGFVCLPVVLLSICAIGLLSGCSGSDTGEVVSTVSVSGSLTFKGRPLEYHQVAFFPNDGQRMAIGVTDESGRFVLGTNREGDGAVEGTHRVAITYVGPPNNDPEFGMNEFSAPPPPKIKIPAKYRSQDQSGIVVDVPPGGLSDFELKLE